MLRGSGRRILRRSRCICQPPPRLPPRTSRRTFRVLGVTIVVFIGVKHRESRRAFNSSLMVSRPRQAAPARAREWGEIQVKYAEGRIEDLRSAIVRPGDILIVRGNGNRDLIGRCGRVEAVPGECIYPDILMRVRV